MLAENVVAARGAIALELEFAATAPELGSVSPCGPLHPCRRAVGAGTKTENGPVFEQVFATFEGSVARELTERGAVEKIVGKSHGETRAEERRTARRGIKRRHRGGGL